MAKIPQYRRQRLPGTNVGEAPLSTSAANVGAGAFGQGLQAMGMGIEQLGQAIERNNRNKDDIANAELRDIIKGAEEQY